jgi:hypothetical protein
MNQFYESAQLHLRPFNSSHNMFTSQTPTTPSSPLKHCDVAKVDFVSFVSH